MKFFLNFFPIKPFSKKVFNITNKSETWTGPKELFYRNPITLLQKLMSNSLFEDEIVLEACKHFNSEGIREYGEIHWSDFWLETQVGASYHYHFIL